MYVFVIIIIFSLESTISSEVQNFVYSVVYLNRAPLITLTTFTLPNIREDTPSSDNGGAQVGQLASAVASDDDDSEIGLAIVEIDNSSGIWEYREAGNSTWVAIPSYIPYESVFLLPYDSWVRFLPRDHYFGSSGFTARAWDMTNNSNANSFTIVDTSGRDAYSGPYSFGNTFFSIEVTHENDPPQITLSTTEVVYVETTGSVQIFPGDIRIEDVDNSNLQSATLFLRCSGCSDADDYLASPGSGTNLFPIGDSMRPIPNNPIFMITTVSSDSLETEILITPRSMADASIESFTQFLQSLYFVNSDQEPLGSQRSISLTVNDGTNSSSPTTVVVIIELVNDEAPSVVLPSNVLTYIENSGAVPIFISDPTIQDLDDNALFNLSSATLQLGGSADLSSEQLTIDCTGTLFLSCVWDSGILTISGDASISTYQQVLGRVEYINRLEEPLAELRIVSITVFDGTFESPPAQLTIEIELINDRLPVLEPNVSSVSFFERNPTSPPVRVAENITISDPDSGMFPVVSLKVVLVDPQDIGEERVGIPRNMRLPSFVEANLSDPYQITFTLRENANASTMMPPMTGLPLMVVQNLIRSMLYSNRAVQPTGDSRNIAFTVYDDLTPSGVQPSEVAVVSVDFVFADDLPEVRLNSMVIMYSEGQEIPQVVVAPEASVTDVDNSEISGLLIELISSSSETDISQEILRVTYPSDMIVESNDTVENELLIQVVGVASTEVYTSILRSLSYEHTITFGNPDSGNRIIQVTPFDLQGNPGVVDLVTIAFTSVDNPPILDLNGPLPGRNFETTFQEAGEPESIPVVSENFTLVDVDTPGLQSIEINLSPYPDSYEEGIFLESNSSSLVTIRQSNPFSIVLQGEPLAPVEEFAGLLLSLRYINAADEPSPTTRNIIITASDGNNTVEAVTLINIVLTDDSPTIYLNGSSTEFSTMFTEQGSPVELAPNPQVVDPDSRLIELRIIPQVTLPGDNVTGSLPLESNSNLGYSFATLPPSTTDEVEQLLSSFVFTNTHPEPEPGVRIFCFQVVDSEQLVSNQACTSITIDFINDNVPNFDQPAYSAEVTENQLNTFVGHVRATDDDSINSEFQLIYSIVAGDDCMPDPLESSGFGDELFLDPNSTLPCRFSLNNLTGEIFTTSEPPDREARDFYLLILSVSDGVNIAYSNISITILDEIDVPPRFDPDFYNVTIPLGAEANFTIATLNVVDPDVDGVNIILLFMDPSIGLLSFGFERSTGRVYLRVPESELDPTVSQYTVTYEAIDNAFLPSTNTATLVINVVLNNADPVFQTPLYSAIFAETTPVNASLLTVQATDGDTGSNGELRYSLSPQDIPFSIDPVTGEIILSSTLDFEASEQHMFYAIATDMGRPTRSSTAEIQIQVENMNEFFPEFTQMVYTATVCESVPIGYEVLQVVAVDDDSGVFGEVTYSVLAGEGCMNCLSLNSSTGIVTVAQELDFESYTSFRVFVSVVDGGFLYGQEADIVITVVNDNEFPPIFQFETLALSVSENYPVGNPLPIMAQFQPLAVDMDSCDIDMCDGIDIIDNSTCSLSSSGLTYSITSGNEDALFDINPETGSIVLTAALDFDLAEHRFFTLELFISDGEFNSTAELLLTITDVNDNQPMFGNASYAVLIPEDTTVGSEVLQVTASDTDPSSQIFYLLSGINYEHFSINTTTGSITVAVSLDYETIRDYQLMVIAIDSLSEDRNNGTAAFLIITLTDVNDVIPEFTQQEYSFSVVENKAPAMIGMVQASDQDSVSPLVRYFITSVSPGGSNLFIIGTESGEIVANVGFDREQYSSYSLSVEARDNGIPQLTGTATVIVEILDRNDKTPIFSQNEYNISIPENITVGVEILQVEAMDQDVGLNGEVTYSITSGDDLSHFSINASSGSIQVNDNLDRETIDQYILSVQALDSGSPPNTASVFVYITITDEGDNPPVFTSANFSGEVVENSPRETFVVQVEAVDMDLGVNAEIAYMFAPDVGQTPFAIDSMTGVVSVDNLQLLDRELMSLYQFNVEAYNPNYPSGARSSVPVIIRVTDVNDESPTFVEETFVVLADEDFTPVGSTAPGSGSGMGLQPAPRYITTVAAVDLDEVGTPNSQFTFSIIQGDTQTFTIDPMNGNIYAAQPLDREATDFYQLLVEAVDMGTPSQSSRAYVNITIVDINDNAPSFSEELYSVSILEDVLVEMEILRVSASDFDDGSNSELRFSIIDNSIPFTINSETGQITPSITLDREQVSFYTFTVLVSDLGTPAFTSNAHVEISLIDVNDNPPVVIPDIVNTNITENAMIETVIASFAVTDEDEGLNALSNISLSGESSRFSISNDGILVVSGLLDYEITPVLTFSVVIRNIELPHFTQTVPVTVELVNLNDNPPVVVFGVMEEEYIEGSRMLPLDFDITIVDDDGRDITRLIDGIVEFTGVDPREPSEPFTPNSNHPYLPYECPLEIIKYEKLEPCGITVVDSRVFTRSSSITVRNLESSDFSDDTIVFNAAEQQYVYSTVSSTFSAGGGLTIFTWIWVDPVPNTVMTIVSKSSSDLLYSLYCSPDMALNLQYSVLRSRLASRTVTFEEGCAQLQNGWHHLAVVLDNSITAQWSVSIFIDGALYGYQPIETPVDSSGSVFVGTRPMGGRNTQRRDFFNGRLHLLVLSYDVADTNNLNCAIGCGVSLRSSQSFPTLTYSYDYSRRALLVNGTNPIEVYESFLNSLILILPLAEPVSSSYSLNYTVQDDVFNCLSMPINITLRASNDHIPTLSLSGDVDSPDYSTIFVEEMGPVPVVNQTAFFLRDGDLVAFVYVVTVQILNPQPSGSNEILTVQNFPNEMNVTYGDYTLRLSGDLPLPLFEDVVRTMQYNNLDDEPAGRSRHLLFTVIDTPEMVTATTTISLVPVNDVPELFNLQFGITEYSEEQGALPILESLTIVDSDNTALVGANITFNALDSAQEILSANVSNTNIAFTYDATTNTLTLQGEDSLENYTSVLLSLTYQHLSTSNPTPGTRRFVFVVFDGVSTSTPVEAMLFFGSINDPPVLDLNGPLSGFNHDIVFIEDDVTSVPAISPNATLIDVDNTTLTMVRISLTPVLDAEEIIIVESQFYGTEVNISNETGIEISSLLSSLLTVRYQNLAEEPTGGVRNIEFVVGDGIDSSVPVYTQVTVQTVNDVPVLDISTLDPSPGYQTNFTEEGPAVYITSRNVSVRDNDADATIETVMVVIQNPLDGQFERIESTNENVTIVEQSPAVIVIIPATGSLSEVEALLLTLTYINTREEPTVGQRVLTISVSDGTAFSNSEVVLVNVESVNEHSPQFLQPSYSRSALEEQPAGLVVAMVTAMDRDGGQDGMVAYNITDSDPPEGLLLFQINASGQIYTTGPLDREMVDFYNLTVSATDGGIPPNVGYASVLITVLDVNDQAPVFPPTTEFNLTVLESRLIGYTIDTVEATDADVGSNAIVSFTLASTEPSPFDILPDGQIIVTEELEADIAASVFTIRVIASDNGTDPLSTEGIFTITVLDVNDNAPQFVPDSNYSGMIQENLPAMEFILSVAAVDIDSGSNADIVFSFAYSSISNSFSINSTSGEIFSARSFDREAADTHTFTVLATNPRPPSLSSSALVTISITDQNDVSPVFELTTYSGAVQENAQPGTFVLQINATDGDVGSNANLTYAIVPSEQLFPIFSNSPLFSIDSVSGEIFVGEAIDYELQPVVNFTVEARDLGSPSLTGSTMVVVNITDKNDNRPVFNQTSYMASIPENEANYFVITIEANDADSNDNGRVQYRLLNEQDKFAIDPVSGDIQTLVGLDFEADCFYRLVVVAEDNGVPSLNATVVVDVSVLPVHDVPPSFSLSSYTSSITENQPSGTSIIQLFATDGDLLLCDDTQNLVDIPIDTNPEDPGSSGNGLPLVTPATPTAADGLEYFLLNYQDLFTIDRISGLVTTLVSLDREVIPQYILRVQARDPGGLVAETSVTLNILDQNDNFPSFLQPSYTVTTSENSPIGTSVLQVIASDQDSTDQGRLVYSLSGQQNFFGINSQSGIIFITSPIDFESVSQPIVFSAVVTDTASREAAALVRITVTNINDLPPAIGTSPQTLTFTEGSFNLRPFPQISISDRDSSTLCNATITLTSPQGGVNDIGVLECVCYNSSVSGCSQGCLEFIQLSPLAAFSGNFTQSMRGSVLVLSGEFPIEDYETAIASVEYVNLITNPIPQDRTLSISVNDCQLPSNTLINTIEIDPLNVFAPVVDLNGPAIPENSYVTSFTERGDAVFIASPNATITDEDSATEVEELTGLDVWIDNPLNGPLETLIYPEPFTHPAIMVTRNSAYSLSFRGVSTLSDYEAILIGLRYDNDASEPDPTPRMINVVAIEYHLTSNISVTTVNFITFNDHPPVILTSPPLENNVVSFMEGSSGVLLTSPDAVISDSDSVPDPITELQVYVIAPTQFDRIFLPPGFMLSSNITVEDTGSAISMIFRGLASQEDYVAILRSLTYQYTGDEFVTLFPPKLVYLQISDTRYSSFSVVQVNLDSVNDQAPEFTESIYTAEAVPENATIGYVVIQVMAVDNDRFSPSNIRYSIVGGNGNDTFSISEQDGTITLTSSLDFETVRMYDLIVEADDPSFTGSPSTPPSQAAVIIPVGDINDHIPMFDRNMYNATIGEGVPIGTPVLQVNASDRDSQIHSMLEFELAGSNDFAIDRMSGVISTTGEIDREVQSSYMLLVTVRNPGSSAFDAAVVTVTVLDLDDNPPIITLQQDLFVLQEPDTFVPLTTGLTIADFDPNPSLDYALVEILPSPDTNSSAVIGQLISIIDSNEIEVAGNGTSKLEFTGRSQPLSEYTRVLGGIVYQDLSDEPVPVERIVAYQVGSYAPGANAEPLELQYIPSEIVSNVTEVVITVELVNDNPPVLWLDSRDQDAVDFVAFSCQGLTGSYSTNFTEDGEPVSLSHSSFSLTDADIGETMILYAVVQTVNPQDIGFERLSVQLSGGVTLSPVSDDFSLVLEGPASISDFKAVLRSIR